MCAAAHDHRNTAQKEAVRRALGEAPGFISASQLHQRLTEEGSPIGLATIYRHLHALAEDGRAETIPAPGGQRFRACTPGTHHHHLVCENCGKAVEISPPDETWIEQCARAHGYTVTRHVVEVFGVCPACPVDAGAGRAG